MPADQPMGDARRTLLVLLLGPALGLVLPELWVRHDDRMWRELAGSGIPDVPRAEALLRLSRAAGADVVVVGDSVAFHSVDERLLEERLGLPSGRVLNLAVRGASAVGTTMLAADALDLRPRVLVYVAARLDLSKFEAGSLVRYYSPSVAFRLFHVEELFRDRDAHLEAALEWASVVHRRARPALERRLVGRGALPDETPKRELETLSPELMALALRHSASEQRQHPFASEGPSPRAVRLLAELTREAGATPVFLQAPLHPGVAGQARIFSNYSPQVEAFLSGLSSPPERTGPPGMGPPSARLAMGAAPPGGVRSAPPVHVPAARLGAFVPEDFRDATHLARRGRERLTSTVGDVLVALLQETHAVQ
jgi:hypothetical protein